MEGRFMAAAARYEPEFGQEFCLSEAPTRVICGSAAREILRGLKAAREDAVWCRCQIPNGPGGPNLISLRTWRLSAF
jgi:hypothetical protein